MLFRTNRYRHTHTHTHPTDFSTWPLKWTLLARSVARAPATTERLVHIIIFIGSAT